MVLGGLSTAADDENSKVSNPCWLKFYNEIIAFRPSRQRREAWQHLQGGFEMWASIP
jgi:hypothetical protein